jgi:hypothetical protein
MPYKTIVLAMLEERPRLRAALKRYRQLLPTLELYAEELKISHETWKTRLRQAKETSGPAQIASEALELAIAELAERLPAELDEAMLGDSTAPPPSSDG